MREVPKVWGKEVWLVNCDEYCGKYLYINEGAKSSWHYHPKKKETFCCLRGEVLLTMGFDNKTMFLLVPSSAPKTIEAGVRHQLEGVTDAVLLEISTHHEDSDVVRLTESADCQSQ